MTLQSAAGNLHAHWRTTPIGYDATNIRLIDQTGNGRHLLKLAGAPAFATYGGAMQVMTMDGTTYFGGPKAADFWPSSFTLVAAVYLTNIGTGKSVHPFWALLRDYAATNDPAWENPTDTFGSSSRAALGCFIRALEGGYLSGGNVGNNIQSVDYVFNAWNILQLVVAPKDAQFRFRLGNGPWDVSSTGNGAEMPLYDEIRLGFSESLPVVNAAASAQFILFKGDPPTEKPTEYAALITALMVDPQSPGVSTSLPEPSIDLVISDVVGTTVTSPGSAEYQITKTGADADWTTGSANSATALTGDFIIRISPTSNTTLGILGVTSDPNADNHYISIDFALYMASGTLKVFENGGGDYTLVGGYLANDNFFIKRSGGTLTYGYGGTDGVTGFTAARTVASTGSLYFDSAIFSQGAVYNVKRLA